MDNVKEFINSKYTKQELIDKLVVILNENNIDVEKYFPQKSPPDELVASIVDFYNNKNIIKTRTITSKLSGLIKKAIGDYGEDGLRKLICRYNLILKDTRYFFSYEWNLETFLSRKEGISAFVDDGKKWQAYINTRPVIDTTRFFNVIWGIYPNHNGIEQAREEFDKKFLKKNEEESKKIANYIYKRAKDYVDETDDNYVMKFANWLKSEIPNT